MTKINDNLYLYDNLDGIADAPENDEVEESRQKTPTAKEAELTRLSNDLLKLVRRNEWKGVEGKYQEILALNGVEAKAEIHFWGAIAASNRGDTLVYLERLELALSLEPGNQTYLGEINGIYTNYGKVKITLPYSEPVEFLVGMMPMAADQRNSIEFVRESLEDNKRHKGMLPIGEYTFNGTKYTVQSMIETGIDTVQKIDVSPRFDPDAEDKNVQLFLALNAGYQTIQPLYGPDYKLGGLETRAALSANYSFGNSAFRFQPELRLSGGRASQKNEDSGFNETHLNMEFLPYISYGVLNFRTSLSPIIASGFSFLSGDENIFIGSSEVPIKNVDMIRTPQLGVSLKAIAGEHYGVELAYRRDKVGIEGDISVTGFSPDELQEAGGVFVRDIFTGGLIYKF